MKTTDIELLVSNAADINPQAVRAFAAANETDGDEYIVVLAEFGGPRVTDVDQIKAQLHQRLLDAGCRDRVVIEIVRPGWLATDTTILSAEDSAKKYQTLKERRQNTELIFNSTFEANITEEEKDAFGYFGAHSKIRTPASIAQPRLVHIGNWVSLGRLGKIFMQTSFEELKKYLHQHYPSIPYDIPEHIWAPRTPRLKIGDGATIGDSFFINCNLDIEIGIHAGIADRVYLSDANHLWNNPDLPPALLPNEIGKPIRIGDHTWLGINSVVINGAKVGKHSIVSSNSVVTRDVPDYCLAVGNPAKIVPLNTFGFDQKCAAKTSC